MSAVNQKTVAATTARVTEHRLDPVTEHRAVRWVLTAIALIFLALFLVVPLVAVFAQAFAKGVDYYFDSLKDPDAWSAIKLTLIVAAIAVPLNVVFGLTASWSIAKFEFRGKAFLTTLIDLPFSVSPVVSGLIYVLMFGAQGWFGPWLIDHNVQIIFAVPGIVLATVFVTRADPADAGARQRRRRSRARAWRVGLADLPPRNAAEREMGFAVWRDSL
jgi:sulfate transport system permease protein